VPHLDLTPPVVDNVSYASCLIGIVVSFTVNEHADMWLTLRRCLRPVGDGASVRHERIGPCTI
jgi:hypothetical protein